MANGDWTEDELRAAVEAYVDMQRKERTGERFTKKGYYEKLAAKYKRTDKAFEYRMQNISYVLSVLGREWISGLKPAKNIGAKNAAVIEALLAKAEGQKTAPTAEFEITVREAVKKPLAKPSGEKHPSAAVTDVTQFRRDPAVKAWVLQQANGRCECCGDLAPFRGSDGLPYLEVHHVRQLAAGGSDTVENAVAVCPNCHRELHYGENSRALVGRLYARLDRIEPE